MLVLDYIVLACVNKNVLGMWSESRKHTPIMKLYLTLWAFAGITIVTTGMNTFVTYFCRKGRFYMMTKLQYGRRAGQRSPERKSLGF
jgi:hypothetical protein